MLEQLLTEQLVLEQVLVEQLQSCCRWQMSQGGCNLYQRNIQSDIQGDIQGEEDELGRLRDQLKVHLEWLRSCGLGSPGLDNIRSHIGYTLTKES